MRDANQVFAFVFSILWLVLITTGCASIPQLNVHYRLPPPSTALENNTASLKIEDARAKKTIIGPGAERDFKNFPGNLSLSVARHQEKGFRIGIFSVTGLLEEVVKRRLTYLGLDIIENPSGSAPAFLLVIRELTLDLVERKWVAKMAIETKLLVNGKVKASQSVSGQAEWAKILGRAEADKAMGEIFTDVINQVDVVKLFRQAGLLKD